MLKLISVAAVTPEAWVKIVEVLSSCASKTFLSTRHGGRMKAMSKLCHSSCLINWTKSYSDR